MNTDEEIVLLRSLEATQRRLRKAEYIFTSMLAWRALPVENWSKEIKEFMESRESGSEPSKPTR